MLTKSLQRVLSSPLKRWAAALLLCVAESERGYAQVTTIVRESCQRCELELQRRVVIEDPEGLITDLPVVVIGGPHDRIMIGARFPMQHMPIVIDYPARSIRQLARRGPGPGEIGTVYWTAELAPDTVRVFMVGRSSDFELDHKHIKSMAMLGGRSFVNDLLLFRSGIHVVVPAGPAQPVGKDFSPLIVRSADGSLLRRVEVSNTGREGALRVLGRARDHHAERFWTAESGAINPRGYSVHLLTSSGKVLTTVKHEPAWWRHFPRRADRRSTGPSSSVMAVRESADGKLLVLVTRPKADWQRIPVSKTGDRGRQYEVVLVVLDPAMGREIGSVTIAGRSARFISDSRLLVSDYTDDMEVEAAVVDFRIRR